MQLTPATMTPLEAGIIILVAAGILAGGIWLQWAAVRWTDRVEGWWRQRKSRGVEMETGEIETSTRSEAHPLDPRTNALLTRRELSRSRRHRIVSAAHEILVVIGVAMLAAALAREYFPNDAAFVVIGATLVTVGFLGLLRRAIAEQSMKALLVIAAFMSAAALTIGLLRPAPDYSYLDEKVDTAGGRIDELRDAVNDLDQKVGAIEDRLIFR